MFHTGRVLTALVFLASFAPSPAATASLQGRQACAGEDARTQAPHGALVVDQEGAGHSFTTIGAAVAALKKTSTPQIIFIMPGTYYEQVYIPDLEGSLIVQGATCDYRNYQHNQVTITSSVSRNTPGVTKNEETATMRLHNPSTKLYNLNIMNMSPAAPDNGQALALHAAVGELGVYACTIRSWQDTLLADTGRQFYVGNNVTGNTDFIFTTTSETWIEGGVINPLWKGCITASGRKSANDPGIILLNRVNIIGSGTRMSYLGRPWKEFARVRVQNSYLGAIVKKEGWKVWDDTSSTAGVTFEEFNNVGPGSEGVRAKFSRPATSALQPSQVLGPDFSKAFWYDPSLLPADFAGTS